MSKSSLVCFPLECWEEQLLAQYSQHMALLPLGPACLEYRRTGARRLLGRLKGKDWFSPTIAGSLSGISSYESSFLTFLLLYGYVRPGYDYLFAHKFSSMVREASVAPMGAALKRVAECGQHLGFGKRHIEAFIPLVLLRLLIETGRPLEGLTHRDLEEFRDATGRYAEATGRPVHHYTISLHAVENVLFHLGVLPSPAVHRSASRASWAERLADLPQPGFRRTMVAFAEKLGTTHRFSTVLGYCRSFRLFSRFMAEHAPTITDISQLDRQQHIEPWLIWNAQRVRKLQGGQTRPISQSDKKNAVLDIKCLLEQITEWGWAESPHRTLVFKSDLPKVEYLLPRYIPKEQEERLMEGIRALDNPIQRYALLLLRATGMRIGELVDLELDCVHHVPGKGAWLKIPLGKLHTERMVPLDDETLALLDALADLRGAQKPLPHPLTGEPTEFLFVARGKRVSREFIRDGLTDAVQLAGLLDQDGSPLRITPHQLRHTYATALINAGVTVQALMHLLGHVTMEMSLRYGHLFDSTVRHQYEQALEAVKRQYAPTMYELPTRQSLPPYAAIPAAASDWMEAPKSKTRLPHGYCLHEVNEQNCEHANVCERCSSFVPLPEARAVFEQQLNDTRLLVRDATARGWDREVERHRAVVGRLESLLASIPESFTGRRLSGKKKTRTQC